MRPRPQPRTRRSSQAMALVVGVAALAAGCVDPTGEPTILGELRVRSLYPAGMEPAAAGVRIDSVRTVVRRPGPGEPLVDRVVADPGEGGELRWILDLIAEEDTVHVSLEHRSGVQPLYVGDTLVVVVEGAVGGVAELHDVPVAYVGPTPRAVRVDVRPERAVFPSIGGRRTLRAVAVDAAGDTLARPVFWTTTDRAVATVDGAGEVVAVGIGDTEVIASLDGVADTADVRVDTTLARSTTITAEAASLLAINQLSTLVTVRVLDDEGRSVGATAGTVELETSLGTLSVVTDHLDGSYTATLAAGFETGTAVVRGTLDGVAITDTAAVEFFGLPEAGVTSPDPLEPDGPRSP